MKLHHKQYISLGGEVYQLENIRLMTPRQHIQTHQENKYELNNKRDERVRAPVFVRKIYEADYYPEEAHTNAVLEFERISEHPSGSDLLYYPEAGKSGPEAVVKEVKE